MVKAIYLPGLGDHRKWFQDKLIWVWRFFGVKAIFHPIGWASGEAFEPKLNRIIQQIDELTTNGDKIALVGVSAGGGAALNAYMARPDKISAVVFIVGKVYGVDNVNQRYFKHNPAFKDSLNMSDELYRQLNDEDRAKMFYIYSNHDRTVLPKYNLMRGVKAKKIFALGHITAFYFAITFHAYSICRFIKAQSKNSN
jgi:pimeloyl-ACP methyl ester carboxylesterase